ncbi:cell division protein FtsQ [Mergibacter septicus]|uniref:cell division protein FtsQ/DivIB n=1 Tax=Mergibacter septicus TaxID=221402 RepID=UPI001C764B7E|nr:cell division protein FtsQ/DivIB [Mergibacter septicus]QDJ12433.1 cell division protein FtsQ [Mergibacter septicus]
MRYQQAERKREKSVRFWSLFKPLFFCALVIAIMLGYQDRQFLADKLDLQPLSSFALLGEPTYTKAEDIRSALGKIRPLKGYFGQDIQEIQQQLERLSWVKKVVVRKIWPDRLLIQIDEYTPVARWNTEQLDNDLFLTSEGTIFSLPKEKQQDLFLPDLSGPDFQRKKVLTRWQQIAKDLHQNEIKPVALSVDERDSWQITLANGIILHVGRDEWRDKIVRFVTIYPHIEIPEHKKIDYVDLRYNDGIAVGFKDIVEPNSE